MSRHLDAALAAIDLALEDSCPKVDTIEEHSMSDRSSSGAKRTPTRSPGAADASSRPGPATRGKLAT